MNLERFETAISGTYPGRGIFISTSKDGKFAQICYFIMGRSENSRNRIFVAEDTDVRTEAFDKSKLTDPSLIIYNPLRVYGDTEIITNGDQTDTIFQALSNGKSFEDALNTRTYEPDPPHFTPRISSMLTFENNSFSYDMSILRKFPGDTDETDRSYFHYTAVPGEGHFIHTYSDEVDGVLIPFKGEPKHLLVDCEPDELAAKAWAALNADNKVSMLVRTINLETKAYHTVIINKHVEK